MKLTADIANERHELEIKRDGERLFADVDGRHYELEVRETEGGGYLLIAGGRVYDCRVSRQAQPGRVEVHVRNRAHLVSITDPKRLGSAQALAAHTDASAQLVAPMPGKVVRVLVELGSQVEAGASVVVVEAMKMQNEMKSPKDGTVTKLNARVGATVNAGEVLAVIE